MSDFAVNVPLNNLSFGQVSVAILREIHKRGLHPAIFPIGPFDISSQKDDPEFKNWIQQGINSAQTKHNRNHPVFRLWHITNSLESVSHRGNNLLTFQETGQLTELETNVLKQQNKVYVTNRYAKNFFNMCGVESTYIPLGFDAFNFHALEKRPRIDGVTSFVLLGKAEDKRKWTYRQLSLWAKKYGNKPEYRLNCAITNSFLKPEQQNALIGRALDGKRYWNIQFLQFSQSNAEYNSLLQSSDIVLCCSGSEGFGLPEFHAAALGAWPVALEAHSYLDFFNKENAIFVKPNGMTPIYDNIFFSQGQPINQGNVFSFSDEDFYRGCEEAEDKAKTGLNKAGLELQKMTYKETVDALLSDLVPPV